MRKKGQAAMEFLMTYGWAILAAIVVIGALGTYFYFKTGATDSAFIGPPLYAVASNIQPAQVNLDFKNNGADDLTIASVNVTGCGINSTSTALTSGSNSVFAVTCDPALTDGDSFKGDVVVKYTKAASTIELTSTGTVSGTVVA